MTAHFCLRVSELQSKLLKSDLVFGKNDKDKEIISPKKDFLTKNPQGGLEETAFASIGVISNPQQVQSIKCYLSLLNPQLDCLFQRAYHGGLDENQGSKCIIHFTKPIIAQDYGQNDGESF